MRKNYLGYLGYFVLFAFIGTLSAHSSGESGLSLEPTKWYLGEVVQGEIAEKIFSLVNDSDEQIEILKINACCGYEVLSVSAWCIASGEKIDLAMSVRTEKKSLGADQKKVTIVTNKGTLKIPVFCDIIESPASKRKKARHLD